jgi:hypothetical protein
LVSDISAPLHIILAAGVYQAEGQFLLENHRLRIYTSLMPLAGCQRGKFKNVKGI